MVTPLTQHRHPTVPLELPPFIPQSQHLPPAAPVAPALPPPAAGVAAPQVAPPNPRQALWENVVTTQFSNRVGSKREKVVAGAATTATFGATGAVIALSIVTHNPVFAIGLPILAGTNGVLGLISLDGAVGTFRHTRAPRPGALRRHSFYLTGIVETRSQSRHIVAWLTEQGIVGEGRLRPILQPLNAQQLTARGIKNRLRFLSDTNVQQIADTLDFVRICGEFVMARPAAPDLAQTPSA